MVQQLYSLMSFSRLLHVGDINIIFFNHMICENSLNQLFDSFINLYFHCTKAHLSGGYSPTENNRPMSFLNLLAPPASFSSLVRKKLRVLPLKKCRDSFLPPNKVFINSPSERRNGCGGGAHGQLISHRFHGHNDCRSDLLIRTF